MAGMGPVANWPVADDNCSKLPNREIGRAGHFQERQTGSPRWTQNDEGRLQLPCGATGPDHRIATSGDVSDTRPSAISKRDLSGNVDPTKLVAIGIANVGQVDRSHPGLARTG